MRRYVGRVPVRRKAPYRVIQKQWRPLRRSAPQPRHPRWIPYRPQAKQVKRIWQPVSRRPPAPKQLYRTPPPRQPNLQRKREPPPRIDNRFPIELFTCDIQNRLKETPIDNNLAQLEWPSRLTPIFAISLRPQRFTDLQQRMKRWASLVSLVPATDGSKVNYKFWKSRKRLAKNITKGQIGCYESHCRIWQRIVDENLPHALVLEDDANIVYAQQTVDRLNECLHELETLHDWDLLYIGNIGLHPVREKLTKHINRPSGWEGLYTYYLTQAGARKLLRNAFPIWMAVDIYVGDQAKKGNIKTLSLDPPLNFVVPVQSDTDIRI